jgi:putative ABC transport system permease protein
MSDGARPLSLRFALRELRSGLSGFRIFLACLALGVTAIAAAGSTAEAFRQGLASQAREILGGDLSVSVEGRDFTVAERAAFNRLGRVAEAGAARAMAQAPSGDRRLVELRGVDGAYPLAGTVEVSGAPNLAAALAPAADGTPGAAVEPALLERLHLNLGDRFMVGNSPFIAHAVLTAEPDRIGRGFALGPRVLARLDSVSKSGLLDPGGLFGRTIRIALPAGGDPAKSAAALHKAFPNAGFDIRDRGDAAPGARRLIDRLEYFLGFIGLASLLAGGMGVFGAVSAYLETRKPSIAVLKALGAAGPLIRDAYLIQVGLLAVLGVAIGLGVGAAAPLVLGMFVKDQLPIPALFAVYPGPLIKAAAFGLLSAAAFSLEPLARARATPPASLFRRDLSGRPGWSLETAGAVLAGLGLAGLTIATAPTPLMAAGMIGAVGVALGVLWLIGRGAVMAAGRLRAGLTGPLRLGLANLAGPRSAARTATPAIGLGAGLLAAVVLIQSSLLDQVRDVAPRTAPAVVFTEIPAGQGAAFDAAVAKVMGPLGQDRYLRAPLATGRIVALNGQPVARKSIRESQRWAFDNDISISVIGPAPPGANVVAGRWWPAAYAGPPLVAMEQQIAEAGGLRVGDTITVSLLGREITARIAVLRKVDWGGFGPSFALILDPAAVAGAQLRQVAIARPTKAQEQALTRSLGRDYPGVNVISVRETLEAAASLFDRLALAIRGAAAVAALAGVLVLAGAIAAGAGARAREAAMLKVLGAGSGQIVLTYAVEYGAVGLIAALAGVGLGAACAWPVVTLLFQARWSVDWSGVAALIAAAAAITGAGGLIAALQALSRRPAPVLRGE